jgi:hypothetical protein
MTSSASNGGQSIRSSLTGCGLRVAWAARTWSPLWPANGVCPASISYATTPSA